jgi:prevent-host-death family protein
MQSTHAIVEAVDHRWSGNDWYTGHMGRMMTATEVKVKILALLDEVAAGDEVEITKHGHVVARLVPASGAQALKGKLAGVAMTVATEEEDLFTTGAAWNLP